MISKLNSICWKLFSVILLSALFCGSGMAQLTSATIVGTITDTTGAVVPGAQVTATNTATHFARSVVTDSSGGYRIEFLPIGPYSIQVKVTGFETVNQEGVVLTLNAEQHYNAALKIGLTDQSITISEAPPLVETTSSSVGRTIQNTEVDNLPLVGRNVYDLVNLAAGVQSNTNNTALGFPQQVIYINGGTDNEVGSVSYYLDGGINMTFLRNTGNVLPNPDALQELNVITNSYNALYGRASSGIVNVVTKSGTNQLHGSVFEFFRSDKLNAYPQFAVVSQGKSRLHRNQFGATIGGPIIKDKTFFFGSYGGLRQNTADQVSNILVPWNAERASGFTDFSDRLPTADATGHPITSCTQTLSAADTTAGKFVLCMPSTTDIINGVDTANKPVPNNNLALAGVPMDHAALNILKNYIPAPNSTNPAGVPVYGGYVQKPQSSDEFLAKVDHNLTQRQRLEVAYYMSVGSLINNPGGSLPMFWSTNYYPYRQQNANVSDTWTISDHRINQVWLNYTRMNGGRVNIPATSLGDLGSSFQTIGTPSLPQVTVTSYFTLTNAISGPKAETNFYGLRDVYTWIKGKHSIGIGGEANLDKDIQQTNLNNYGVFSFTATTNTVGGTKLCLRTCNSLGDFALGLNSSAGQDTGLTALDNTWEWGMFVQDDWKILRNLTLNLGLRWDIQTAPTDPQNREATWVPGAHSTKIPILPTGLLVAGDPGVPRGIVDLRLHHVSPRVGFAFDPFGNGKTAVRGAAGVFYGLVSGNLWNATSNFQPFATRTTFTPAQTYTFSNPYAKFPGGVSPFNNVYNPNNVKLILPNSLEGISPDYQWPYTYQMNLAVQQQFTRDFSVTISYIGSLSHNIPMDYDANAPQWTPTQTSANKDSRRPLFASEQIQQVYVIASGQSAHYHALQVDFNKRLSNNFSFNGYYIWSRTMESASVQNTTAQNNPQNFNYINEDYGRTDNDLRNRFVAAVVWKTDYFSGYNRFVRTTLNGWTISAVANIQSGYPYSVTTGTDTNIDGNTNDRASYIPGANISTGAGNNRALQIKGFINKAAFCAAGSTVAGVGTCPGLGPNPGPKGLDGNAPRDNYTGPDFKNVNAAIFRDFGIYERTKFQFRAEATNVFNLVNLANPNASLASASFGQISAGSTGQATSNSAMRIIQLGARILF
jgi:Carboxypeptidase regulatory-like domain